VALNKDARNFIAFYYQNYPNLSKATEDAKKLVESIVLALGIEIHAVSARAKDGNSLREKLLRKPYTEPKQQLTDLIGVRVVTYYGDDVDKVARALQNELEIDAQNSVDRRTMLGLRSFGYRSVHLIARLKGGRARSPEFTSLRNQCFEIQVRSILEHAWAEIEHTIVYKSGIAYSDDDLRMFAALAGAMEILDKQFLQLRERKQFLVDRYLESYSNGKGLEDKLDVARLIALLTFKFPDGSHFPPGTERSCLIALQKGGIRTVNQLARAMQAKAFITEVRKYSVSHQIASSQVSFLALVIIIVLLTKPNVAVELFPNMFSDPGLDEILQTVKKRIPRKLG
jgi:ppGpp synthetase/RelA/SpoT-type nucleotidyltranferase